MSCIASTRSTVPTTRMVCPEGPVSSTGGTVGASGLSGSGRSSIRSSKATGRKPDCCISRWIKPSSPTRLRRIRSSRYCIRTPPPGRLFWTYSSTSCCTRLSSSSAPRPVKASPWRDSACSRTQWVNVPLMLGASSAFCRGLAPSTNCMKYPKGHSAYRSNRVGLMCSCGPSSFSSACRSCTAAGVRSAARRSAASPGAADSCPHRSRACSTAARAPVFCCHSPPSRSSAAAGVAASIAGESSARGTASRSSAGSSAAVTGSPAAPPGQDSHSQRRAAVRAL